MFDQFDFGLANPLHHYKTAIGEKVVVVDIFKISENLYALIVNDGEQCDEYPIHSLEEATRKFKEQIDKFISQSMNI